MTQLPPRSDISDQSSTQGTIREALGDMRDYLFESLGEQGGRPNLSDGDIRGIDRLAVRSTNLNSDARIVGSLNIDDDTTTLDDPGKGSTGIANKIVFNTSLQSKIHLNQESHSIGSQSNTIYLRTSNDFTIYRGGSHVDTRNSPGEGGSTLLSVTPNSFQYQNNDVWHAGNQGEGSGLDADLVRGQDVYSSLQEHIDNTNLHKNWYNWSLDNLSIYRGDHQVFVQKLVSQGDDEDLLSINHDKQGGVNINAKNNNAAKVNGAKIWNAANDGTNSGLDADLLDGLQGSSYLRRDQNSNTSYEITCSLLRTQSHVDAGDRLYLGRAKNENMFIDPLGDGVNIRFNSHSGSPRFLLQDQGGSNTYTVWHSGNDGGGSGLDADSLRGVPGSSYIQKISSTRPGVDKFYAGGAGSSYYYGYQNNRNGFDIWARDNAGNKQGVYVAEAGTVSGGVGRSQIHVNTGSVNFSAGNADAASFTINRFAFQFDYADVTTNDSFRIDYQRTGRRRQIECDQDAGADIRWLYVVNSGNPKMWSHIDSQGEILSLWEAEDPADEEFPDDAPMEPKEGLELVQLKAPTNKQLIKLLNNINHYDLPTALQGGVYDLRMDNYNILKQLVRHQLSERFLDDFDDLEELFSINQVKESEKRDWRKMLTMRSFSRVLFNQREESLYKIIQSCFRVSKKGNLVLK